MIGILRVRFTSNTSGTTFFTDTLVESWMQPLRENSLANFWWLSSHALFDLDYTLFPELSYAGARITAVAARQGFVDGVIAAADAAIAPDWSDIDILMIVGEQGIDAFGGGGAEVTLKNGEKKTVAVTVVDCFAEFDVVCQELGHSFGLAHETRRDSRAETTGDDDYASPYSVMSARFGNAGADPEWRRTADPDLPEGNLAADRISPALHVMGPRLPGAHLLSRPAFADSGSVLRIGALPARVRLYAQNYQLRDAPSPAPVVAALPSPRGDGRTYALELRRGGFDYDRGIGTVGGPPAGVTVHAVNPDGSIRYDGVAALADSRIGWASRRGDFHVRFVGVHPQQEYVDLEIAQGGWTAYPIRGVLLAGGFRRQQELLAMSLEDMRNTLIVELTKHSSQSDYQRFDDDTLAGMGAVLVFLRRTGIRDDAALRTMSADDQRNTLIVEIGVQTGAGRSLQGLTDAELVQVGLGSDRATRGQRPGEVGSWIRGVLLLGGFRTQHELTTMSHEDQRNTLIVELTGRSNESDFQAYDDLRLAGAGAVLVVMRSLGIRDDRTLRTMSADDMRNTLIVEMNGQTGLGARLQSLSSLELALIPLGIQYAVD